MVKIMDKAELEGELFEDLYSELEIEEDDETSAVQLKSKIKNAIREVKSARRYPESYTDDDIISDLYNYYGNIHNLALYDYNQIGVEGQTGHNENGTSRTYKNRSDCLLGVVSMCRSFSKRR